MMTVNYLLHLPLRSEVKFLPLESGLALVTSLTK